MMELDLWPTSDTMLKVILVLMLLLRGMIILPKDLELEIMQVSIQPVTKQWLVLFNKVVVMVAPWKITEGSAFMEIK